MKKRTLALVMACAMSLSLLTACGSKEQPAPAPEQTPEQSAPVEPAPEQTPEVEGEATPELPFDLSHVDVTLKAEGENFVLTSSLPDAKLYFGSSDEGVVTVDENGTVTAVAPGQATILVETEDGRTAQCVVRCDWKVAEEKPEEKPVTQSVDLMAFYQTIMESAGDNAPFMMDLVNELGAEGVESFYPGLTALTFNQQVMFMPAMSAVACEIAMVECANAADVETVKTIFQNRINTQAEGGAWYPETIEGWKNNSDIVVEGNYVAMFVIPEGMMDAASAFSGLF